MIGINDFIRQGVSEALADMKKLSKKEIKLDNKPSITSYILIKLKYRNGIFVRLKKHVIGDAHLKTSYNIEILLIKI